MKTKILVSAPHLPAAEFLSWTHFLPLQCPVRLWAPLSDGRSQPIAVLHAAAHPQILGILRAELSSHWSFAECPPASCVKLIEQLEDLFSNQVWCPPIQKNNVICSLHIYCSLMPIWKQNSSPIEDMDRIYSGARHDWPWLRNPDWGV